MGKDKALRFRPCVLCVVAFDWNGAMGAVHCVSVPPLNMVNNGVET
jgi:hypothetical protein